MSISDLKAISIVASTDKDIPAITRIYAFAVTNMSASFELHAPDEDEMRARRAALIELDYPYLIAKLGESTIGYAYAGPYHSRPGYKWSVENTVYIDPEFQKLGAGTALMRHLIEACTYLGYRQMIAVIGDGKNSGSIKLHKKLGFTHIGTNKAVGRKFNRWLDVDLMQRELGKGASTSPDDY